MVSESCISTSTFYIRRSFFSTHRWFCSFQFEVDALQKIRYRSPERAEMAVWWQGWWYSRGWDLSPMTCRTNLVLFWISPKRFFKGEAGVILQRKYFTLPQLIARKLHNYDKKNRDVHSINFRKQALQICWRSSKRYSWSANYNFS